MGRTKSTDGVSHNKARDSKQRRLDGIWQIDLVLSINPQNWIMMLLFASTKLASKLSRIGKSGPVTGGTDRSSAVQRTKHRNGTSSFLPMCRHLPKRRHSSILLVRWSCRSQKKWSNCTNLDVVVRSLSKKIPPKNGRKKRSICVEGDLDQEEAARGHSRLTEEALGSGQRCCSEDTFNCLENMA